MWIILILWVSCQIIWWFNLSDNTPCYFTLISVHVYEFISSKYKNLSRYTSRKITTGLKGYCICIWTKRSLSSQNISRLIGFQIKATSFCIILITWRLLPFGTKKELFNLNIVLQLFSAFDWCTLFCFELLRIFVQCTIVI